MCIIKKNEIWNDFVFWVKRFFFLYLCRGSCEIKDRTFFKVNFTQFSPTAACESSLTIGFFKSNSKKNGGELIFKYRSLPVFDVHVCYVFRVKERERDLATCNLSRGTKKITDDK